MKISKLKGFTLVELIIVVVIIGILAAISIVGYTNQATKARRNSAHVALSDAVRAAATCIAAGDTLRPFTSKVEANTAVCEAGGIDAAASSALWPDILDITNDTWDYNTNADGNTAVAADGGINITVGDLIGTTNAIGIHCTNAVCAKHGF